jgi:hypothetical protein
MPNDLPSREMTALKIAILLRLADSMIRVCKVVGVKP